MAAIWDFLSQRFELFLIYKSSRCFLPSFESIGLSVQKKKGKIDFQDGHHLGFPIVTILAIFISTCHPEADRSKAVVPVLVLLFVALWFILQGNLLYVVPCVILFLCFSVLLVLRLPRLGKRELILVLFVRLFGLCLFGFVGFLFLLGSGKGCGL